MIANPIKLKTGRKITEALSLVVPLFKKYKSQLLLGLLAMIVVDILQLAIPRVIKSTVDGLSSQSHSQESITVHALIIVGLALGVGIFRFIWRYLIIGFSRLLERDLRNQLFSHILTLDKAFFQKYTGGQLIALSTNDMAAIQLACGMGIVAFVDAFIMLIAALTFMVYINPTLTIIAIAPLPILAFLTKFLAKKLHYRFRKVQEQFSTITQFARTAISSIRLIKIYNQAANQSLEFDRLGRQYIIDNIKVARIQGALFPISTMLANISLLLTVFFGGRLTISGQITIGDFVAFISYLFMLTWPMMAIGWVANLFQRGVTSLGRIKEVLEERPSLTSTENGTLVDPTNISIKINNLSFTYPTENKPVLKNINLEIKPGLFGIIGQTGCGKSTLCDLLARFFEVPGQTIFYNDTDINNIAISKARELVAYVPQNTHLFSDTIRFNISLGKPDASDAEIESAAKSAAIHAEISAFPKGYQTRIGEKGVKLSGGQKQRIALARALLAEKPIIIIDDGLSAVDVDTESAIIRNLKERLHGKTAIVVSHRLSPLTHAYKIAVMADGQIAAIGNHKELFEINDYFKTIHKHQNTPQ